MTIMTIAQIWDLATGKIAANLTDHLFTRLHLVQMEQPSTPKPFTKACHMGLAGSAGKGITFNCS